jgi:hypothetical protein
MNQSKPDKRSAGLVYTPTPSLRVAMVLSTLLFAGFALITAATGGAAWVVVGLAAIAMLGVIAIAESLLARIEVRSTEVAVRGLRGVKTFGFTTIEEVRLEGGQVHFRVRGGGWVRMPPWLPGNRAMSLRSQVASRLKVQAERAPSA